MIGISPDDHMEDELFEIVGASLFAPKFMLALHILHDLKSYFGVILLVTIDFKSYTSRATIAIRLHLVQMISI